MTTGWFGGIPHDWKPPSCFFSCVASPPFTSQISRSSAKATRSFSWASPSAEGTSSRGRRFVGGWSRPHRHTYRYIARICFLYMTHIESYIIGMWFIYDCTVASGTSFDSVRIDKFHRHYCQETCKSWFFGSLNTHFWQDNMGFPIEELCSMPHCRRSTVLWSLGETTVWFLEKRCGGV